MEEIKTIHSFIHSFNMNESKLKRKGKPKLLSELEQKKSWSGSQGKFAGHAKKRALDLRNIEHLLLGKPFVLMIQKLYHHVYKLT